ncbi:hypothetical protein HLB44_01560 [Aquincola sp. S2]|uniref:MBL fold metallo-hydrolase n=1 Tax=Pseudaquabacterium terrae TaxID=2732868 RepID=A0ABX2EAA3_9BURK|nr:hypothetical protein [Aquabacterium terrae]NRF65662.1 hypothetical protein [Aquabacterium terrae]
MLSLTLLPAAHGDAIWIEYGPARGRRRVLIDGGPAHTYAGLQAKLEKLKPAQRKLELFVVSHIDADHIDGALILLQDRARLGLAINEVWFNTWAHLPANERDVFAPLQGEFLGALIGLDAALAKTLNKRFGQRAVVVPPPTEAAPALPVVELAGGARLTLLGPNPSDLKRLRARWSAAIRDFTPGDAEEAHRRLLERREYRPPTGPAVFSARAFGDDRAPANGSSIAFLFEADGQRVLFGADAHARTLATNLARLCLERGVPRVKLDAVKLPHHGSMGNVSAEWLALVDCERWLVSTNGAVFGHPDVQTAALVTASMPARKVPSFHCNYQCETTERLRDGAAAGGWKVVFPPKDAAGLTLQLG